MEDMPRPRLPHLIHERVNGRMVWYVRVKKGPRTRITADYGSEEFTRQYMAALSGAAPSKPAGPSKGSLKWLVAQWRGSSDWLRAAPSSRKQRENILLHVFEEAGDYPFEEISEADIVAGRERRKATPHAANNFLKVVKALFKWAKEMGHVDVDPAAGVRSLSKKTDGFRPWTVEDVARFRARWPLGTRERLALEIFLNTGLRRGDVARLGRPHVKDGVISIKTEKTGTWVHVPILPELQAAIDAGPVGELTFLSTRNGRPMVKEGLGNWFREACDAAGVEGSAHGVRKLAATLVADGGASEKELQAVFGWVTNQQSALYTREADNKKLAMQALRKRLGNGNLPDAGDEAPRRIIKPNKIKDAD